MKTTFSLLGILAIIYCMEITAGDVCLLRLSPSGFSDSSCASFLHLQNTAPHKVEWYNDFSTCFDSPIDFDSPDAAIQLRACFEASHRYPWLCEEPDIVAPALEKQLDALEECRKKQCRSEEVIFDEGLRIRDTVFDTISFSCKPSILLAEFYALRRRLVGFMMTLAQ